MTRLTAVASAAACATAALLVRFVFRIGPVVVIISARDDRALHLDDLVMGVPLALAAILAAVLIAR